MQKVIIKTTMYVQLVVTLIDMPICSLLQEIYMHIKKDHAFHKFL
jgi:hypothetical protein